MGFGGAALGRATIAINFKPKRKTEGWEIEIQAKNPTDIAVQALSIQPGGHTGWHTRRDIIAFLLETYRLFAEGTLTTR